jgi:hypothetical protein
VTSDRLVSYACTGLRIQVHRAGVILQYEDLIFHVDNLFYRLLSFLSCVLIT